MNERILILEDNIENFGLIYQQLRALGYHGDNIYKFGSLRNLLSIPADENKIIIAQYSLLGPDHAIGLQNINEAFAGIPVIITAGMTEAVDAAELLKAGAQDCLINGQFNHETLGHSIQMSGVRQRANVNTVNTPRPEQAIIPKVAPEPEPASVISQAAEAAEAVPEQINIITDNYHLFDESPIPMWIYDLESGRILKVNAAAIYHYGYSREEFLDMGIQKLKVDGDKPVDVEVVKIPLLNSFYNSSKRRHTKKNGDIFYVQVYTHTIIHEAESAGMMMALDINTRYKVERENNELLDIIKNQNNQFDNILSSVSEVIWSCNADDSRILYINNACTDVYGYTPDELMENAGILPSLVHPDDIDKVEHAYMGLTATGHMDVEHRVYDKDGALKKVVTRAVLRKGEDGGTGIVNGVTMDVTSLREIESKLKDTARQMETIMESITDGFFAINKDWEFTYVNKEFERILQLSGAALMGRNIWETVPGVEEMEMYAELYTAVKENRTVHFEEYFPPLKKWLSVNAYPASEGLAVYFRDVTEEKQRILKIEEQNQKLTEIAWLQSHKVRGPVASILGLVQLFNYDDPTDPANKEILEGIKFASTGLDDIIKEVVEKTTSMYDLKSQAR